MSTIKAIKAIVDAYSDCNQLSQTERNLKFKSGKLLTPIEVLNTVKLAIPDGYNGFDASVLQRVVDAFGPNARYRIAREGSVCLYIKVPANTRVAFWRFSADEISYEGLNTFRLWWD